MALYGKRIFISILIATLITWPLPPMAVGASTNETAYWSDVHTGIQSFGGQILQLQQKYLTQKQAIADQLNRQKYIQANQPKAESSKYFPKCLIPPSNPTLPTSLCEISSAQANAGLASSIVSNGQTAIEMAKKYQQQFYTPMQQKAQNTNYPIGLQCLEESRDELLNQMQDKLNALDAYIGQINQENQQLRDQANNFLETIKEANYQLNGGNPDTNTKQAFDLQKSLGAACTNTLGVSAMDNSRGLRGLKSNIDQNFKPQADKILAAHSDVAGTNNEGGRLFNQQIKDIQQYLQKYGIEGLGNHVENGRGIGLIPASQVATIVKRFEGDLQTESANLQKDLQNYGIAVPALDANFLAKSKSITGGSQGNQIENTIITNCINGQGEQALGIPLESLIASITQKNVSKTAGSTAHDYQNQLRKIWHSNNSYQNKLKLTQQLDHKIGQKAGISVTYQDVDNQQRQIKELPSAYFARAVDKCKTQYQQMGNSSDGRSGNAQTQSATKALAALQKNVETFSSNVVGALKNELLNCRNQTVSLDQCSSSLDPGQGNFCWQQATTCASQINNCASKTQDLINAKVTIANQAAHNYNQNLKAFITKQQLFLKTVQNRIFADANYLRQMFPNNNFNYQGSGADIFVPMPELTTGQGELAGVSLLGGGNTEQNLQGLSDA
ncbi:MAG: hypothetical protein J6Y94_05235, partial [Bacteriovoracaceae bacterium]|nr:hypothetical protein [Bacteriovoracaceae bacterium]